MTPRDFIAHFDTIAEAPNGIARLREFVLRLAVRGRLVPQNPADEPANRLIERTAVKRTQSANKKTRNNKSTSSLSSEMTTSDSEDLPSGWIWTCTADLGVLNPRNQTDDDAKVSFCPMPVIPTDYRESVVSEVRRWGDIKKGYTHFAEGDVVVAKITPCFQNRKSCIMTGLEGGIGAGTTELHVVRPFTEAIVPKYLLLFYKSPDFLENGVARMTGTAGQQRIPREYFAYTPLPLPPLAEQHRIVTKVDELMDFLDRLEESRRRRENMRTAGRDSSLAALRTAGTADEIKTAWMRIATRMDDLFITLSDISPLRDIVFQLAIQGQLAPQNDNDEPATTLLDRIDEEKKRLIRKKKIGKPKHLVPVTDGKVPFAAPSGWTWCRLGSILKHCRNGISASPNDSGIGYPMLRISAATSRQDAVVNLEDYRFADVTPEKAEPYLIEANDLLACRFNGNLHFVGRVSIVSDAIDRKIVHPDKLIKLQAIEISPQYLCYAMNAESTRKQIHEVAATTAGNIGINGRQLQNLLIPIPPLTEQYRITSKVGELVQITARLEYHLATKKTVHDAFSTTAVHHLAK